MKKRVLLYIDSLTCGGAEKSLVSLLPLLDYNKMDVTLMLGKRGGLFERYIPQEVKVISLPEAKGLSSIIGQILFSVLYRLYGILGISRHGAELLWSVKGWTFPGLSQKFDVAIAYQQGFPTYYVAKKVDATRKFAWINVDIEKAGYRMRFNNKFYKIYDGILAVSDALRNLVIEQGYSDKSKTGVVYDIINVDMIRKMADEFIEMSFSGIKIVTVGRLTPPKNHILAVETAKRLKDAGVNFHWWFVGGGCEYDNIANKVKEFGVEDYITITGTTPNPYPYMKVCDIYVQTSSFEGFCLTLNEARILNRPVVTTNFPAAYNQITDGENGLIAEMTSEALSSEILKIIGDEDLREKLIEGTRKEVNTTATTESRKVNRLILGE